MPDGSVVDLVRDLLAEGQRRGYLGPGALERHIAHAEEFWRVYEAINPGHEPMRALDLGTGGGLPGLVLAQHWTTSHVVMLEASARRAAFLEGALMRCAFGCRVEVVGDRAEAVGRRGEFRGSFDVVTARSFGRPGVTAECAAPLLKVGGILIVSEPPDPESTSERWPEAGLEKLGQSLLAVSSSNFRMAIVRQVVACPDRYPRRVGLPTKRPVF